MTALAAGTRINTLPRSGIRALMDAAVGTDAIRLEIGDPDFATPIHIVEAAAQAARDGFTHYAPSAGLATLRGLIVEKLARVNGLRCSPEDVVVTTGGSGALFTVLLALLDPGDEVLVPNPGWPNYHAITLAAGGVPVEYALDRNRGFEPELEALERAITPRARVLIVNTPANPTGAVVSRRTVEQLVELARRRRLWLVSDECYDELVFEGEHVSAGSLADDGVVSVFSFSKTYAMTGWRVGYAVSRRELAQLVAQAQEAVVSCVSTVSQKAAEAALLGPQEPARRMAGAYRQRRDAAAATADALGLGYFRPRGAFYLMVDVPEADSEAFARHVLTERGVAVTPGRAFGSLGEGMVRVSLAAPEVAIATGLERLAAARQAMG